MTENRNMNDEIQWEKEEDGKKEQDWNRSKFRWLAGEVIGICIIEMLMYNMWAIYYRNSNLSWILEHITEESIYKTLKCKF